MLSTRLLYVHKIDLFGFSLKTFFRSSLLEVERFLISVSNPAQRFSVTVKPAGRGGILIFLGSGGVGVARGYSITKCEDYFWSRLR